MRSDAIAEASEMKILRYNASTGTLTEHVDADDTRPPQLGIHYHVGFENKIYIDEYEGIRFRLQRRVPSADCEAPCIIGMRSHGRVWRLRRVDTQPERRRG